MKAWVVIVVLSACVGTTMAMSAIHAAVEANDPSAVRAALGKGVDINEVHEGQTPLMHAASKDKLRAAAALMKMGADATLADAATSLTPMDMAAAKGYAKIIKLLLRYKVAANDMHPSDGLTPFHRACLGAEPGHTDAVFAFLEEGIPPDQLSRDQKRPIEMAGSDNTRQLLNEAIREKRRR